jgi:2'-5' RNA ligase
MTHARSSTQLDLPEHLAKHILAFAAKIPKEHLAGDGKEKHSHITVKYGLDDESHEGAKEALKDEHPAKVTFGHTSLFKNPDADVLKVEVTGADLHRLHRKLNSLPHGDTYPDYAPHSTIAYLRPGMGRYYTGQKVPRLTGRTATFREVMFKGKTGKNAKIELKSQEKE